MWAEADLQPLVGGQKQRPVPLGFSGRAQSPQWHPTAASPGELPEAAESSRAVNLGWILNIHQVPVTTFEDQASGQDFWDFCPIFMAV